jgi:hypothetical protein
MNESSTVIGPACQPADPQRPLRRRAPRQPRTPDSIHSVTTSVHAIRTNASHPVPTA